MDAEPASSYSSFEDQFEAFHVASAEGRVAAALDAVEAMRAMLLADSPPDGQFVVYREMLDSCARKAGEACLEDLRRLCQQRGTDAGEDDAAAEAEMCEACYAASSLGKGRQAATIFGGFLRTRLKQCTEANIRKLSSQRARYRLNVAAGGKGLAQAVAAGRMGASGPSGASESDAQPHVTALAAILAAASKHMARLSQAGLEPAETKPAAELLHQDCQRQAVQVLTWFEGDSAMPKWREQAQVAARGGGNSSGGGGGSGGGTGSSSGGAVDVQGMDFIVDELAFLCQLCQRYLDFCADRMRLETERSSDFLAKSLLLEGEYVRLEDAYLLASVGEAVRIAEPIEVAEGVFVSSMVEDAGFLLQKSLVRSVSTYSEQALMAVCNRITEIVGTEAPNPSLFSGLCLRIRRKRRPNNPAAPAGAAAAAAAAAAASKSGPSSSSSKRSMGDAGNAMADLSAALARALEEAVEDAERSDGDRDGAAGTSDGGGGMTAQESSAEAVPLSELVVMANSAHVALVAVRSIEAAMRHHLDCEHQLVQTMLKEIERLLAVYEELLDSYVAAVIDRVYPPIRRALRQGLASCPRAPDSTAYEKVRDSLPGFAETLAALRDGPIATECRRSMVKEVYERAITAAAACLGAELAELILPREPASGDAGAGFGVSVRGGYNEWGALLLQRGVRAVQRQLSELSESVALAAPFAKVTQLLLLLNLERPVDVAGYRIPPEVLAAEEVRRALGMRADFSPEAIKAIKF